MTDKLTLYNMALGHLEQRKLASLSENREPRRVLDDYWDQEIAYILERKFWNFAYRAVQMDASSTVVPQFGFLYAFPIPDDWIRTRLLSAEPTFMPPLLDVKEESSYWWTNITPIFVQYNSNDPLYGMNLGNWPATFADYAALRLARQSCKRITGSTDPLNGPEGLIAQETRAYKISAANCAMNEAIGFAPPSSWARARRTFGSGAWDYPTGGQLIP